jgi:hypothetical protein
MDTKEYQKVFGIHPRDHDKLSSALEHALDIRKFEIDLYWKRATYFWTLIASAFAAYFVILNTEHMKDKDFNAYIVSCIGFLFTFSWLQVNRGSKQWQENWENHVDLLEDDVIGPLYKTRIGRPNKKAQNLSDLLQKWVTGPAAISVSKTNQIVNLFVMIVWLLLGWNVLEPFSLKTQLSFEHIAISAITVIFCTLILIKGTTDECDYEHVAIKRTSKISD